MAAKYLCDECGSRDDVKHLRISFELDPLEPDPRRLGDACLGSVRPVCTSTTCVTPVSTARSGSSMILLRWMSNHQDHEAIENLHHRHHVLFTARC
jgi:hypothetical protein